MKFKDLEIGQQFLINYGDTIGNEVQIKINQDQARHKYIKYSRGFDITPGTLIKKDNSICRNEIK